MAYCGHGCGQGAGLASAVLAAVPASADEYLGGWQKKFPVVKYGVIPVETQGQTTKSMDTFLHHAEKETGAKWELYTATDYSGVMNALIGKMRPASLAGIVRADSIIQTAMHTRALHRTPRTNACSKLRCIFASAMAAATPPCPD